MSGRSQSGAKDEPTREAEFDLFYHVEPLWRLRDCSRWYFFEVAPEWALQDSSGPLQDSSGPCKTRVGLASGGDYNTKVRPVSENVVQAPECAGVRRRFHPRGVRLILTWYPLSDKLP